MIVEKGTKGLDLTWQLSFTEETKCSCGKMARIAFVAKEEAEEERYISTLHENKGRGGFWPHDAVAVAVYFCPECFTAVTLWNQA